MIARPSQASIEADAVLVEERPSHVRTGETADGMVWVASYVGDRASFCVTGLVERHLLTHEQADALCDVAPKLTIAGLRDFARGAL